MDHRTRAFLAAAEAGKPVFIGEVRNGYLGLDARESFPLTLRVTGIDGREKCFALRLPRFAGYSGAGRRFAVDFFLAEIYNILSSMGGRRAVLHNPKGAPEAVELAASFTNLFGVELPRHERTGYGKCLNVADRMLQALPNSGGKFVAFHLSVSGDEAPAMQKIFASGGGAAAAFRLAAADLAGRAILGVDIGGTDIKLALSVDGRLAALKEFDWNPAAFARTEQIIEPVLALIRLMGLSAQADLGGSDSGRIGVLIAGAMRRGAELADIEMALARVDSELGVRECRFDALGVCFPDVVVGNKIVGGETPKNKGLQSALGAGYDQAFAKLTNLDLALAPFVREGGCVSIVNDGVMAAFTTGVEMAASRPDAVASGVFAHTLGTDLGTGWVDERGGIPDIPLEVYNFIIDLGSLPEREFPPDDVRSINNFNTLLPGTVQKFVCQSGVFRLAMKYLNKPRPDLIEKIRFAGLVVERETAGRAGLYVPTYPKDMRKPFLEFMMDLAERDGDPAIAAIFEDIGAALAETSKEIDWILGPAVRRRTLYGRLVKKASCFGLIRRGAAAAGFTGELDLADEGLAETSLMRELAGSREYSVAQFAQAVGAVYYGNYCLARR